MTNHKWQYIRAQMYLSWAWQRYAAGEAKVAIEFVEKAVEPALMLLREPDWRQRGEELLTRIRHASVKMRDVTRLEIVKFVQAMHGAWLMCVEAAVYEGTMQ